MRCRIVRVGLALAVTGLLTGAATIRLFAADHGDAPVIMTVPRQDLNLTDLHAFTNGDRLVISLCSNAGIPTSATSYRFPSDVTFQINIDVNAKISDVDPTGLMGGTVLDPSAIREDLVYKIDFSPSGAPRIIECRLLPRGWFNRDITRSAMSGHGPVNFWAGLRDDPFIRGPRQGRNVGAMVLEILRHRLWTSRAHLLIWGTSTTMTASGPVSDLAGRALRSMFGENQWMNPLHPSQHQATMGVPPDVLIYDLKKPAAFPNGRALTDDVVDIVNDPRVLMNDMPFPTANDVPFLTSFPYLAEPHAPPGP
jgi:hypothetical protein